MNPLDPKPAQQDSDIEEDESDFLPIHEEGEDLSDDVSLDIETEDNWIGMLRKVGLKPKENLTHKTSSF